MKWKSNINHINLWAFQLSNINHSLSLSVWTWMEFAAHLIQSWVYPRFFKAIKKSWLAKVKDEREGATQWAWTFVCSSLSPAGPGLLDHASDLSSITTKKTFLDKMDKGEEKKNMDVMNTWIINQPFRSRSWYQGTETQTNTNPNPGGLKIK